MQIVTEFMDALKAHDWAALAECLAEDLVRIGPSADVHHGKEAYVRYLMEVVPRMQDHRVELDAIHLISERLAVVEMTERIVREGRRSVVHDAMFVGIDDDGLINQLNVYVQREPTED